MGITDFFKWLESSFLSAHVDVPGSNSEVTSKQVDVIIDLTGEWRCIHCPFVSVKVPEETSEPDITSLTRFFPVNVLTHLDGVINKATEGLPEGTSVRVWIVTDDSSIPVHIKEETRAQRKHYTKQRLETARAETVSYKDVDRIYNESLSFTDGRISHLPIVADVFCSKESRPFRIKLVEWLIEQSQYFRWKTANLQLNFVVEGVKPVGVIPVVEENKRSSTSFRDPVVFPLHLPLTLCAEADVFVQYLVRYIAATDVKSETGPSKPNQSETDPSKPDTSKPDPSSSANKQRSEIIVSAVDSDICALLIALTMDYYANKKTCVPKISFFRFARTKKDKNEPVIIDVDALARFFVFDRTLAPAAFLGGCILMGTDFFQKKRIFCGLGPSHVLNGIIAVSDKLVRPFSIENKKHFEQLLVAAILSKENRIDLFAEPYNRSLDAIRSWFLSTVKKVPNYVPDKTIYETEEESKSSYRKIPAKGHHWPIKDAGARDVYQAFRDNYDYWAPSVLDAAPLQESSRVGSPLE